MDGRDPLSADATFEKIVGQMRQDRQPAIVVMNVERLDNHTNADDQRTYRSAEDIDKIRSTADPILNLKTALLQGGKTEEELAKIKTDIIAKLRKDAKEAQLSQEPQPEFGAKAPLKAHLADPASEYRGTPSKDTSENLSMIDAMKEVLRDRLSGDDRVLLFGEDLEDPKGDVFGLTKSLSTQFPGRVVNSPLAEASILGLSIGYALAGKRPVAFLQFADFLPIAYNQIVSELGSMYWRTDGGWTVPVIVMITCGGYRPGLGPFHASSYEALAIHTPGVDVVMPSSAGDAAGLLNAAFESERPTLFFYPKNCLNDRDRMTSRDVGKQLIPLGIARTIQEGKDITLVGYGNTVPLIEKAAKELVEAGASPEIIDLRSLSPWDKNRVIESVKKTRRLIVAHEDNQTAGMGSEVIAGVSEELGGAFVSKRVTRDDTYVPCNFGNQLEVLPSYKRILEESVKLMGGTVNWIKEVKEEKGFFFVEAVGSSPSDEEVTVIKWLCKEGQEIKEGQDIAEMEADKAAFELKSPVSGTVTEFIIEEGFSAKVGEYLMKVKTGDEELALKPITRENPGRPEILNLSLGDSQDGSGSGAETTVGIVDVTGVKGSRVVTNEEISQLCPDWTPEDIKKRIGIESRPWIAEGETALSLSVDAASRLLDRNGLSFADIDLVICATGTPMNTSPSMAAMIQEALNKMEGISHIPGSYDFSAACSGYIYGLQQAHDFLAQEPRSRVLLINVEVLSPKINFEDPGTAPIFADAATATLVVGTSRKGLIKAKLDRPVLGAHGEDGDSLKVPVSNDEFITMDGPKVFLFAVKYMMQMISDSCKVAGIAPKELDLVIPHQANQRISNAIRQRMKLPAGKVYSNIKHNGNTSSCTVPLCLDEVLPEAQKGQKIGLVAFGGGFTFGGAVLEIVK
jgi:2-oxoisovalerate dehydrogenase E1 component